MKAFISKRASKAAERIAARWREHADDPDVFAHDLIEAIDLLETSQSPGSPFPTTRHPQLKRMLLRRSCCHVYFEIDERKQVIRLLHIWDARRQRAPKL